MKFGLIVEANVPVGLTQHRRYQQMISEAVYAEEAGFDFWGASEQHFMGNIGMSATEVMYAAVAAKTTRIRLRHMIRLLLKFNHPLRIAEQLATLDLISNGRAELGTGRSNSLIALNAFGVSPTETRAQWNESLDIIAKAISDEYGVKMIDVLTGFKFIGEQIGFLEDKHEEKRYIFGFEESYGYLAGSYVRDKDAVVASMLICEMAAFYRTKGISLIEAREKLYQKYGVFAHSQKSFTCEGAAGMEKMKELMTMLREKTPKTIGGLPVIKFADYGASMEVDLTTGAKMALTLPKSEVLTFTLPESASVIIRPSGTEPKIKAYFTTTGKAQEEAHTLEKTIADDFTKILGF